jgi:hypothetical protein
MPAKPSVREGVTSAIKKSAVDIRIESIFSLMREQVARNFEAHAVDAYAKSDDWANAIKVGIRAISSLTPAKAVELRQKLEEFLKV